MDKLRLLWTSVERWTIGSPKQLEVMKKIEKKYGGLLTNDAKRKLIGFQKGEELYRGGLVILSRCVARRYSAIVVKKRYANKLEKMYDALRKLGDNWAANFVGSVLSQVQRQNVNRWPMRQREVMREIEEKLGEDLLRDESKRKDLIEQWTMSPKQREVMHKIEERYPTTSIY